MFAQWTTTVAASLLVLTGGGNTAVSALSSSGSGSGSGSWPFKCSAGENITSLNYDLTGQTWLITGADGRLGTPVTEAALRNNATVVALSYDADVASQNCDKLYGIFGPHAKVHCGGMDLSSSVSIKSMVNYLNATLPQLDTIVHIAATIGKDNITADGFVETMEINVVGPVLVNQLLMPLMKATAPHPRIISVGSADCYDPLDWPANSSGTEQVNDAIDYMTGKKPHPGTAQFYWYSFSKYILLHYAKQLAVNEPTITSFSVNPGFFRDDPSKYKDQCKPVLLFEPCPQYPDQGATSTFFIAAQPGIEEYSGALIDFDTEIPTSGQYPWIQSGDSCIPRPLPAPWGDSERAQLYDALLSVLP